MISNKPPCKFFQEGKCRKGASCPFPHIKDSSTSGNDLASFTSDRTLDKKEEEIKRDMVEFSYLQVKPVASSYGLGYPAVNNLIPERDMSFEELRQMYYEMKTENKVSEYDALMIARQKDMEFCVGKIKGSERIAARYQQKSASQSNISNIKPFINETFEANAQYLLQSNTSSFGSSLFGSNGSSFGAGGPFGAPSSNAFGSTGSSAFGSSGFGSSTLPPAPSKSGFGSSGFGSSGFGASALSAPSNSGFGSTGFGSSALNASSNSGFGSSGFGSSGFGASGFGSSTLPPPVKSAFGSTTVPPPPGKSAFGSSGFGSSGFGSSTIPPPPSAFGSSTFGASGSAFGNSAFGSNATSSASPFTSMGSTASPFSALDTKKESPFGSNSISTAQSTTTNNPFQNSSENQSNPFSSQTTNTTSPFGSSAFGSSINGTTSQEKPSPFDSANNSFAKPAFQSNANAQSNGTTNSAPRFPQTNVPEKETNLDDLADEVVAAFKSQSFELGKIPDVAPPALIC